jgi:hypothetical protein
MFCVAWGPIAFGNIAGEKCGDADEPANSSKPTANPRDVGPDKIDLMITVIDHARP